MSKSIEQIKNLIAKATKTAKSERELSLKGLNFGRWWYEVGEYEKAADWITKYLRVYDKDAKSHKLLGDVYEKLGKSDAALACYKQSLRVKPQQYELMLKVAEMHINPGPSQNPSRAQVWLDKAAVALPNNPQVYKLKMELLLAQEAPPSKLERAIQEELKKRPSDPSLYVQYVSFLKDQERLEEAFSYSQKTDNDRTLPSAVERDLEWNQCLVDTCQEYAERMCDDEVTAEGLKAYSLLLVSLCKFIWLCIEQGKFEDAIENLASLDNTLLSAVTLQTEAAGDGDSEWGAILTESKGQLYWLAGIVLIYQATQDKLSWSEANKLSTACFSVSLSFPILDITSTWASRVKDVSLPGRLKTMGGFRLSQCAHMLRNLSATSHSSHEEENQVNEKEWMQDVTYNYCTDEGKRKILKHLFSDNYNPEASMIHNFQQFSETSVHLVQEEDLSVYDINAVSELSLQTWVWMGMQWRRNFDNALDPFPWIDSVFHELPLATANQVKYGNVWNLCRLDVEAFVVACVLHAEKASSIWQGTKMTSDRNALKQASLPLPLCRKLVTEPQSNWWEAACKLHVEKNKERIFNSNQLKATLRHGIECVRGSANHGMQLMLITGLAKHFAAKAYTIDKTGLGTASAPWMAYQRRASQYWLMALPLLQDVVANRVKQQPEPKDRLFPKTLDDPTVQEARSMVSEVHMCHGGLLVQEGNLKKALDVYGKADTPHASFCEALIYKQMYDNCYNDEYSVASSSATKKKETYLRKYQAQLEITLHRLERSPDDELLRRTEALLHTHDDTRGERAPETEPPQEGTRPKRESLLHHQNVGNHTVNSEVDDSILAIPSKQSTPKNDMKPLEFLPADKSAVAQLSQNLSALTSAVSTLQVQFDEQLNKVDHVKKQGQGRTDAEQMDKANNLAMGEQLTALASIMSGLQLREEKINEQQRQVQQQMQAIQEQVSMLQSQLTGTPVAPSRVIHMSQSEGVLSQTPLQLFDQYQQASLGQAGSPMPGSPYYGVYSYQGYPAQSPALAAMYNQRYPLTPRGVVPAYGMQPRPVLDQRGVPSPVNTPPAQARGTTGSGLQMSKEAADALSVRFQASLSENDSPATPGSIRGTQSPIPQGSVPLGRPGPSVAVAQSDSQPSNVGMATFDPRMPPPMFQRNQNQALHGMTHAHSEPVLDGRNINSPAYAQGPLMPSAGQQPVTGRDAQRGFDESYLPPSTTNVAKADQEGGTSVLKSLLISKQAAEAMPPSSDQKVEINYPKHIHFPKEDADSKTVTANSEWSFKFQTPEEMDRANKKLEADEEAEDAEAAHNDTGPHFEPLVTLPEVEVPTGEENEEEIFCQRSKLYRWHETEWKERGLGNMKIMKHKETGKQRLLMRREQVLKICCNHLISQDVQLTAMQKSDRAWVWHAFDFSDEEDKVEKFAIKFRNAEIAKEFKEKVDEAREANLKLSGGTPAKQTVKLPPQSSASAHVMSPASDVTVTNTKDDTQPETKTSTSESGLSKFKFAFPKPSAAAIDLAAKIAGTPPKKEETPKSGENEKKEDSDTDDHHAHNESDGPHFEPIVKLPEKVEQKTGEEDEEVMFCHRAKLFRFIDQQWKERGLGDIKILHNNTTNKYRIVMRREQVLKICANHYITKEMELKAHAKSDKAWNWTAMDHSDPDEAPRPELLAVRFKLAETAAEFKKYFDMARDMQSGKGPQPNISTQQQVTSTAVPTTKTQGIFKLASFATDDKPSSFSSSTAVSQSVQSSEIDSTTQGTLVAKKVVGQWTCPGCYAPNEAADALCQCCNTPNPSAPKTEPPKPVPSFGTPGAKATGFSFGIPSSSATTSVGQTTSAPSIFGLPKNAPESSKPFSFGVTSSKSSGFSFGIASSQAGSSVTTSAPSIFGAPKSAPSVAPAEPVSVSTTGALVATKQTGAWNCKGCYAANGPSDATCPCCGEPNPNAGAVKEAPKPFSFGVPSSKSSGFSFGITSSTAVPSATTKAPPIFGVPKSTPSITPTVPVSVSSTGTLVASKHSGAWNCKGCYATNGPADATCPCCGETNPNAGPVKAKLSEQKSVMPGAFSVKPQSQGGFSFGIPAKPAPDSKMPSAPSIFALPVPKSASKGDLISFEHSAAKPQTNVISPPKFSFGLPSGTQQQAGPRPFTVGDANAPKGDLPKPRFPSVGYDDEESASDDDEESSGSTEGSSYEEEEDYDDAVNQERYRSPLTRNQDHRAVGDTAEEGKDDDVICLGEVLPSQELQQRAEKLMLPKHFYNFLKDGEDLDKGSGDDEEEERSKLVSETKKETVSVTAASQTSTAVSGFGFGSGSTMTFADLAKNTGQGTGFSFGSQKVGWVGMAEQKPLFANLNNSAGASHDGNEYYESEERDDVHFEPVVKLPEKVEVVTGEEDEETLYSQRCKLFRYNKPTNEWKERGVGDIKLKKNVKTGRIRIVMRREQVLKVCANHYLRPGMTLDPSKSSDRAWMWSAMDFAEDQPKMEMFTARFKTSEIAQEFKEKFDDCQTMLLDADPMTPCKASTMRTKELSDKAEKMKNELKFFKDKFSEPSKIDLENTLTDESAIPETIPVPPAGSLTPLVAQHNQSRKVLAERSADQKPLSKPLFNWGEKDGSGKPPFSLSSKVDTEASPTSKENSAPEPQANADTGVGDDQQEEPEVHFEPIVQLPEKVELVTGEEDEQVIFGNRAKLYVYDREGNQWKERGIGDVKLLQNTNTFKVRVVMRREQVLKVCLNHYVRSDIKFTYKEKSADKVLVWVANDFSDDEKSEGEIRQFALRFKDAERAAAFKRICEEASGASEAGTLYDCDPNDINTSVTIALKVTSPGAGQAGSATSPQSPPSPVKPAASKFSFATYQSPINSDAKANSDGTVNVMGFVFGRTPEKSGTSSDAKFKFDTSKMSFNFTSTTSTPETGGSAGTPTSAFFTPPQSTPTSKPGVSKSLFSDKPDATSDSTMDSNIFSTPAETFSKPLAPTMFSGDQSPALQAKPKSSGIQEIATSGNSGNVYKPSPLALAANFSQSGSAFSVQGTGASSKFQFKPSTNGQLTKPTQVADDDDDDVIFVWEAKPTEDQHRRAENLLLPPTFFLFENEATLPGFDEKAEDEKEDKILQYIEDRDSGKLKHLNEENKDKQQQEKSELVAENLGQETETSETGENKWLFGGGLQGGTSGMASFATMASGVQNMGFKKDPSFKFPGAGRVMFQDVSNDRAEDGDDPSTHKCDAQFKPVLEELPPLIEVKTGEEGEDILFKERCKLFRYDQSTNQWKERGVGDIKILYNDEHKIHRVVMRRDQVYKVCANHVISEKTEPKHHLGSEKTCSYFAMDYSESPEPSPQQFAIRFKNEEICKSYMDKIDEIKQSIVKQE